MKHPSNYDVNINQLTFSTQPRVETDETHTGLLAGPAEQLSVLNHESKPMKLRSEILIYLVCVTFSTQPRVETDETSASTFFSLPDADLSVLNHESKPMKRC